MLYDVHLEDESYYDVTVEKVYELVGFRMEVGERKMVSPGVTVMRVE